MNRYMLTRKTSVPFISAVITPLSDSLLTMTSAIALFKWAILTFCENVQSPRITRAIDLKFVYLSWNFWFAWLDWNHSFGFKSVFMLENELIPRSRSLVLKRFETRSIMLPSSSKRIVGRFTAGWNCSIFLTKSLTRVKTRGKHKIARKSMFKAQPYKSWGDSLPVWRVSKCAVRKKSFPDWKWLRYRIFFFYNMENKLLFWVISSYFSVNWVARCICRNYAQAHQDSYLRRNRK